MYLYALQDKFVPTGSKRLQAYQRLGLVPKSELDRMLDKHLPTTVAPVLFHPLVPVPAEAAVAPPPPPPLSSMGSTGVPVGLL